MSFRHRLEVFTLISGLAFPQVPLEHGVSERQHRFERKHGHELLPATAAD